MDSRPTDPIRIGIDIGGTFTDFVIYSPGSGNIKTYKILSTPQNPAHAVLSGLAHLEMHAHSYIIHGSTVATNALLEGKGVKTALITTEGFKDILLIGRQNRPALYDWTLQKHNPLIPSELSFEISERVDCEGNIIKPLNNDDIDPIIQILKDNDVQSIALSLLFSFLNPQHEMEIAKLLRLEKFFVSVSSEVLPEYREYERTSTTAVNAYVSPILNQYLTTLQSSLQNASLQIMQSNGGMISVDKASQTGVRCILSGPAGGVIGAQYLAQQSKRLQERNENSQTDVQLITFDMGGTSTDVSLINGNPSLISESSIGGYPISIPILDIHTIGAGGGSIAYIDKGGALRVGPQSAGADPGPACYGKGELPTVTDANLVLGRLIPEYFLGGNMPLDPDKSWKAIQHLGSKLGLNTTQCALGIITVTNAHMEHALRVISVERGYDPRDFTLFSFGGAGGLHATDLARNLLIPRIIISPYASVLSAYGMLAADIIFDYVQTVMLSSENSIEQISLYFQKLICQGKNDLLSQDVAIENMSIQLFIDARYQGQSYELTIPYGSNWTTAFHQAHQRIYGFQSPQAIIELVNIRVKAIGFTPHPVPCIRSMDTSNPEHAYIEHREIVLSDQTLPVPCYQHEKLKPGNIINGPAMISRPDTTILIGVQDYLMVDDLNNLIISVG